MIAQTRRVGYDGETHLEKSLAAAVELHAEADAAGLAGAGELAQQGGEDGAGQRLLRQEKGHLITKGAALVLHRCRVSR